MQGPNSTLSLNKYLDNSYRIAVVTSIDQLMQVYAVRSIVYVEDGKHRFDEHFDGNDLNATHFLLYVNDEPVGTSRVRWFAAFAKIEKTAFREAHRNPRILKRYLDVVFNHVAQKGYSTLITTATEKYCRLWERSYGFERVPGSEWRKPNGVELIEMVKHLKVPSDAITSQTPPHVLFRVEGAWDAPGALG